MIHFRISQALRRRVLGALALVMAVGALSWIGAGRMTAQVGDDFNPFAAYMSSDAASSDPFGSTWMLDPYASSAGYVDPFGNPYDGASSSLFDPWAAASAASSTSSSSAASPTAFSAPTAAPPVTQFSDIDAKTLEGVAAKALGLKGIVRGFPDGTLRPGDTLTRAQAAKMLIKITIPSDPTTPGPQVFKDVPSDGQWHVPYVNMAAALGFIKGYPDGTFRPEQTVTRAEFATMLGRLLQVTADPQVPLTAQDVPKGEWFSDSVIASLSRGFYPGEAKFFHPTRPITRSSAIIAIYKAMLWKGMIQE